jgi:hypothetical protein
VSSASASPTKKREQKKRWFRNGQRWRTGCEGRIRLATGTDPRRIRHTLAAIPLAVIEPMPGIVASRRLASLLDATAQLSHQLVQGKPREHRQSFVLFVKRRSDAPAPWALTMPFWASERRVIDCCV